ncbi:MAG: hypothetical protein MUC59_12560 [Saprospiraceae bacterium]|nr:hypothetical protein [Saprospiraceae bacterium]
MKNLLKQFNDEPDFQLTRKEKVLEFVATAMCFMLLFASFLKVLFF